MRIVWNRCRNRWLVLGTLAAVSFLILVWSISAPSTIDISADDVFYDIDDDILHVHRFVAREGDSKPYQRAVKDPVEFVPKRKRTLKTAYGVVEVEDLSFVPARPLKKTQSLLAQFSKEKTNFYNVIGSVARGDALAPAAEPRENPDTNRFYSFLQKIKAKDEERKLVDVDGGKSSFLNSEKMLALQAQMKARENQVVSKKDINEEGGLQNRDRIVLASLTPYYNGTGCKKRLCAEFLSAFDLSHYRYCMKKSKIRSVDKEPAQSQCKFLNGTDRNAVALASHPGSGHRLFRELLQKSTGLCTGGVNCDVILRRNGFPGECLRSGVVLVVKTHQTDPRWTGVQYDDSVSYKGFNKIVDVPVYGSAILLVRDPFVALSDLWQRMKAHGTIADERWSDFVFEQASEWQQVLLAWTAGSQNHPLLIVKYEDLIADTAAVLSRVLDFLQAPYSTAVVQDVGVDLQDGNSFVEYTADEREYINSIIKSTIETVKSTNAEFDMSEYLRY